MSPDQLFPVFVAIWVALSVAALTFYWKAKLETKRRWHPYVVTASALCFLALVTVVLPASTFVIIVPGVALISFLNYKMTKFCDACGRTVIQSPPWTPYSSCPKCGAAFRG